MGFSIVTFFEKIPIETPKNLWYNNNRNKKGGFRNGSQKEKQKRKTFVDTLLRPQNKDLQGTQGKP